MGALLAVAACGGDKRFNLPEQRPTGYAFIVLHDGKAAVDVGPIVAADVLYEGNYRLANGDGSLSPYLFVAEPASIKAVARNVCDTQPTAVRRLTCNRVVDACSDPGSCLRVVDESEPCGDRLELDPAMLGFRIFTGSAGDRLTEDGGADAKSLLGGKRLCGPAGDPQCPDRNPAFVVTEAGQFRCLAPSNQLSCSVSIDLDGCGLGRLDATLDPQGTLTDTSHVCTVEPLTSSDTTAGDNPGFAIVCDGTRFVATYTGTFAGFAGCPHLGPPAFDSAFDDGGVISGAISLDLGDGQPRLLFAGRGYDGCGRIGCFLGPDCQGDCLYECNGNGLERCLQTPAEGSCFDPRPGCVSRCIDHCSNPTTRCSGSSTHGRTFAVTSLGTPEEIVERLNLDRSGSDDRAPTGHHSIARVGSPAPALLAVADRSTISVLLKKDAASSLEVLETARPAIPFEIAGVRGHPAQPGVFIVYGVDTSTRAGGGRVARVRLDLSNAGNQIGSVDQSAVDALDRVDQLAIAGTAFFAASSAVTVRGEFATKIARLDDSFAPTGEIDVPGRVTTMIALDDRTLAVGISRADARGAVLLVDTNAAGAPTLFDVINGLEVSALNYDAARDRLYVGYRRFANLAGSDAAVVGIVEGVRSSAPKLLPPFVAVAGSNVEILELSPDGATLFAISAFGNWVTPITLVD